MNLDWFLRRYGAAFLSANSIYLSDELSIDNRFDSEKLSVELALENRVEPHIAPRSFKEFAIFKCTF